MVVFAFFVDKGYDFNLQESFYDRFMYALCFIVFTVSASIIWRVRAIPRIPIYFWFIAIITSAIPIHTGYLTLFPQESADTKEVAALNDAVSVTIPKDHALLITAELAELKNRKRTKRSG